MKNRDFMPQARQERPQVNVEFELTQQARQHWNPGLRAAKAEGTEPNTISIFDPIGVDFWTGEGVTAKRISAALRSIGADKDVVVNVNSPGGDLFEGFAIYNLLREHKGQVTVKVLGVAASAASIIAMAGDTIQIARSGFMMIHNTWVVVMGNQNDLREVADQLAPFDDAMADIYSTRTGLDVVKVQKMMDAETWINGSAAVDQGFADSLLPSDQVQEDKNARAERSASSKADVLFARAGVPRSERRSLIQELKSGTPRAAGTDTPNAIGEGGAVPQAESGTPRAAEVLDVLKSFSLSNPT